MDYDGFVAKVCNEMQQRLPYANITTQFVEKLQGESYNGISVQTLGQNMAMTINLRPMFEQVSQGADYSKLLDSLQRSIEDNMLPQLNYSLDEITDYSVMKKNLMLEVVSTERNAEMLSKIPHHDEQDMSVIYRLVLGETKDGCASAVVTNEVMERFGATPEQLHADALANAAERFPVSIRSMREVIADLMGVPQEMLPPDNAPMFMATCNDGIHGAGCMFYEGFMEQATERMGGDFFLLPSSIHEVIMVPDTGKENWRDLQAMVAGINADEVAPADQLTDTVYHYDAKGHIFEKAEDFEARAKAAEKAPEKTSVIDRLNEKKRELADRVRSPKVPTAEAVR